MPLIPTSLSRGEGLFPISFWARARARGHVVSSGGTDSGSSGYWAEASSVVSLTWILETRTTSSSSLRISNSRKSSSTTR